jgi:hypothetical protein
MAILRSYSEMMVIMRKIEAEVHRYLPDYKLKWSLMPASALGKRKFFIASNDPETLTIMVLKEYIESAPLHDIIDTTKHEIAHSFAENYRHGRDWKDIARAMGAAPSDTGTFFVSSEQPRYVFRSAASGDIYESWKPMRIFPEQDHLPGRYYVADMITRNKWTANLR